MKSKSILIISASAAAALTAHATDYNFGSGGPEGFTINATDWARDIPSTADTSTWANATGVFDELSGGIYWRGSAADRTYIHFDLASLQGKTLSSDVALNYTVEATYGGQTTGSTINTANAAWTAAVNGAAPGFTPISGATNATGNFTTGQTATWSVPQATFATYVDSSSYYGFVLNGASGTTAHFSGTPTLTGTYAGPGPLVSVTGGTDWSGAAWDDPGKTLTITGSSNVTGGGVTITNTATVSTSGSATWDGGIFAGSISNAGTLIFGSSANQSLNGQVSGAGGLTKTGAGALTLNAANTYSGVTTINGGTLSANTVADTGSSSIGLSAAANALTFGSSGGTLNFSGAAAGSTKRAITFTGAGVFDIDSTRSLTVGTATATPTATDGGWSGSGGITKSGEGTLIVRNTNPDNTLPYRFTVDNKTGGNFTMTAGILTINPYAYFTIGDGGSSASIFSQSGGTVNFTPVTNGGAITDVYIGNSGSGSGQLNVTGGTFNVTNTNNGIVVAVARQGTLSIGGGGGTATVDSSKVSVGIGAGNGIVNLYANGVLLTSALKDGAGGGTSTVNFDGGTLKAKSSSTTNFMPAGFNTAAITANGLIVDTNTFDVTIAQALSGTGGTLTKTNTGTLTLTGANGYTGGTTVNQGTLTVGTGGTIGANTGALTVSNTNSTAAGTASILNLATAVDTTTGSLSGTIATPISGTNTATIQTQTGRTFTVNQTTNGTYAGVIGGAGNFALGSLSSATLTLTGANTYTGATTVSAGTLLVTGQLASAVTVSDTATVGGGGTVGALAFGGGSFFDIFSAIGGNPLDSTTISFSAAGFGIDNLLYNGAAVDWTSISNNTYALITGTLNETYLGNLGSANAYDIDGPSGSRTAYFQSGSLQLVVIPEPRAALLGGLGLLMLLRRRRRGNFEC